MGLIGRIGRREQGGIGNLSDRSKMRWIALSRSFVMDRSRSGALVAAWRVLNSSSAVIDVVPAAAHPLSHCLDGHGGTYCEVEARGYFLELDLNTGASGRKEFVTLEYPSGQEIDLVSVAFAAEAGGNYVLPVGSVSKVLSTRTSSLWVLPWRNSGASSSLTIATVSGARHLTCTAGWSDGLFTGRAATFDSGLNAGIERMVVDSPSANLYLDESFPNPVLPGETIRLRQITQNYLGGQFARVKLRAGGDAAGKVPIRVGHVGLHSFLFEFRGDLPLEYAEFPPNPGKVGGQFDAGLAVTELLNGGVDFEEIRGPRDVLSMTFEFMRAEQVDLLRELTLSGEFVFVDHHGHFRQGYIVPQFGLTWEDLGRAVGRGEERAVTVQFKEV